MLSPLIKPKAAALREIRALRDDLRIVQMEHAALRAHDTPPHIQELENARIAHPKQYNFVMSEKRHTGMVGGVGSAKTFGGALRAFRATQGWIGGQRIPVPNTGLVTAPRYADLHDASWLTFEELFGHRIAEHNRSRFITTMDNGSRILWRAVDEPGKKIIGFKVTWAWMDEAAQYKPDTYRYIMGRMRENPPWDWMTTTPRGMNWVYQTYVEQHQAFDGKPDNDWELFQVFTRENPYNPPEYYEMLDAEFKDDPDFYKQELEGEFVAYEGNVYPMFSRAKHVPTTAEFLPWHRYQDIVVGVDFGEVGPGVMLVIGLKGGGQIDILKEYYQKNTHIDEWARIASGITREVGFGTKFYCDPSRPDLIERLHAAHNLVIEADNRVLPGITEVRRWLSRPGGITIDPECRNLIREFGMYIWDSTPKLGMIPSPVKANDHTMDALRYAIMGVSQGETRVTMRRYV